MKNFRYIQLRDPTLSTAQKIEYVKQFYAEVLVPSFARFPDELEPIEVFIASIQKDPSSSPSYLLNIAIALDDNKFAAGCAFEYYPKSSCGLLTYLSVKPEYRQSGIAKSLVKQAYDFLQSFGKEYAGALNALFLETNSDSIDPSQDEIPPKFRRSILKKLGFECLEVGYVQPALSDTNGKSYDLLLAVHNSFLKNQEIRSIVVCKWIVEFYEVLTGPKAETDTDLIKIKSDLANKEFIKVRIDS